MKKVKKVNLLELILEEVDCLVRAVSKMYVCHTNGSCPPSEVGRDFKKIFRSQIFNL
jgi:hypothetical protein